MPDDQYEPIPPPVCEAQSDIRTRQTYVEGCPVLPKMRCHEIQQGQRARLLWNFHNIDGRVLNLDECATCATSESAPVEIDFDGLANVPFGPVLRIRELSGYDSSNDPVYTVNVEVLDSAQGLVRAEPLPQKLVRRPGVYLEEWAWFGPEGDMLFSNQCCTFVRRGLFGLTNQSRQQNLGPPSLEEIRLALRDNSAVDNTLLDAVEFDSAEIASAVLRPIQYWNEIPPPLVPLQTTCSFPFREMWMMGIQAHLLEIAAHHYRRNALAYSAGGVTVDDKNKEQPYTAAAMMRIQQYQELMRVKKIEINMRSFSGAIPSTYNLWY